MRFPPAALVAPDEEWSTNSGNADEDPQANAQATASENADQSTEETADEGHETADDVDKGSTDANADAVVDEN